jgi:hypothetical protein
LALACTASLSRAAEIPVKSGERIAFMGDSITQGGFGNPGGYVRLVMLGEAKPAANGLMTKPEAMLAELGAQWASPSRLTSGSTYATEVRSSE